MLKLLRTSSVVSLLLPPLSPCFWELLRWLHAMLGFLRASFVVSLLCWGFSKLPLLSPCYVEAFESFLCCLPMLRLLIAFSVVSLLCLGFWELPPLSSCYVEAFESCLSWLPAWLRFLRASSIVSRLRWGFWELPPLSPCYAETFESSLHCLTAKTKQPTGSLISKGIVLVASDSRVDDAVKSYFPEMSSWHLSCRIFLFRGAAEVQEDDGLTDALFPVALNPGVAPPW